MKKILFILPLLLIAGLFLIEPVAMANAETIATAPSNNVTRVVYSGYGYSIKVGAFTPEIDLVQLDYSLTGQGNASVTLTYQGTPLLSNYTYYWMTVTDSASGFTFSTYFSGSDQSSSDYYNVFQEVSDGSSNFIFQTVNASNIISGHTITFTFPSQWADASSIGWNATASSTWQWEVYGWEWTNTTKTNSSSGVWYYNYYPATDNPFYSSSTSANTSSGANTSKKAPGFELITVIAGLFVVVPLYIYKRHRSDK